MSALKQSARSILLGVGLIATINCGGAAACKKAQLPRAPIVRPVKVTDGTIKGRSLDNVIKNHIEAWKYIKELQTLGNFKK